MAKVVAVAVAVVACWGWSKRMGERRVVDKAAAAPVWFDPTFAPYPMLPCQRHSVPSNKRIALAQMLFDSTETDWWVCLSVCLSVYLSD